LQMRTGIATFWNIATPLHETGWDGSNIRVNAIGVVELVLVVAWLWLWSWLLLWLCESGCGCSFVYVADGLVL